MVLSILNILFVQISISLILNEVIIRILRKRVHSCIVGTHCTFILMRTVRIVKINYLHHCFNRVVDTKANLILLKWGQTYFLKVRK